MVDTTTAAHSEVFDVEGMFLPKDVSEEACRRINAARRLLQEAEEFLASDPAYEQPLKVLRRAEQSTRGALARTYRQTLVLRRRQQRATSKSRRDR